MAERRRVRRARQRREIQRIRADANNPIEACVDDHLRAFVRLLARKAAREVFEAHVKRGSAPVH